MCLITWAKNPSRTAVLSARTGKTRGRPAWRTPPTTQISYKMLPAMKPEPLFNRCGRLAALLGMLIVATNAHATLRVWTGNSTLNSDWDNVANWSAGIAPVPGDDLEFPSDGLHPNCTDNYTNGTTFNSILFFNGGSGSPKLYDQIE